MSYRDDRDADQARIATLEAELAQSKARVAELEGRQAQALVAASGGALVPGATPSKAKRWLGAPMKLHFERRFEGAFPTDAFEDLVEQLRAITGDRGRTEVMKSSMYWTTSSQERGVGPFISVTLKVKDGVTTLEVSDRLGQLAGVVYGAFGGGFAMAPIAGAVAASMAVPLLAPVFAIGMIGGFYGGLRAIFKRSAKKRAIKLQQVFDLLVAEVGKRVELSPVQQVLSSSESTEPARERELGERDAEGLRTKR